LCGETATTELWAIHPLAGAMRLRAEWIGPAALLGAAAIWGFVPVSSRYVVRTLTPGQLLVARFVFASLAVLLFIAIARPPLPSRRLLPRAVALGLLGTLGFNVPLAYGIQRVEAGPAALLNAASPIFIALLAGLMLGEVIRPRMIAGLTLALSGSVVVATISDGGLRLSSSQLLGSGLVLLSAFNWGIYSVLVKPWLGRIPAMSIPMLGTLAGAPLVLPLGADGFGGALGQLDWRGWLAVFVFALGASVIASVLFAVGLQLGMASRSGMFLYLTPLFGVIASITLLGEPFTAGAVAGGGLILAGVLIATLRPDAATGPLPELSEAD
jgi:drug/metabolite transporter (DMT)-like permease